MKRILAWLLVCACAFAAVNGTILLIAFPASRVRIRQIVDDALITRNAKGFLLKTFIDSEGVAHRYSVFIPYQMQPDDRLPLLVFLNGLRKNGTDGIAPLYDGVAPAIWELKRNFPFVVVFPQCPKDDAWTAESAATERAFAIMDQVERDYHTDPDRVYLTGLSSGGAGVWTFAVRAPDRFAAIVPVSSGPRERDAAEVLAASHLPVWNFYVRGDGEHVVSSCRRVHRALVATGGDSLSTELNGAAVPTANQHNAWDFAFRNPALYSWLLRQSRSRNAAQSALFQPVSWTAIPDLSESQRWSVDESGWLTCRSMQTTPESSVNVLALQKPADVHFEIRPDGAGRIRILLTSNSQEDAGGSGYCIDVSLDRSGGGGLFDLQSGDCLQPATAIAEACLRPGEWNDVQLVLSTNRIIVRLNQLTAIDWQGDLRSFQPLNLAWSASAGEVGWRFLRVKGATSGAASPVPSPFAQNLTREPPPFNHHIEDVISAWSRRQESVRHARFAWREDRRGDGRWTRFRSGVAPSDRERNTDSDTLVLAQSWAHLTAPWWYPRARIMGDGQFDTGLSAAEFLRKIDRIIEHPPIRTALSHRSVVLQNGHSEDLITAETEILAILSCRVAPFRAERRHHEDVPYRALLLHYRPFAEWGFNVAADRLRLRPTPAFVNGRWCLVVEESPVQGAAFHRVYHVDPQRDFVVVRYAAYNGHKLREQIDFEYDHTGTADWRPVRWSCLMSAAELELTPYPGMGGLFGQAALAMVASDVNNDAADAPPPSSIKAGTVVFDECRDAWYEVGGNGQQRPLTREELASMFFDDSRPPTSSTGKFRYAVVCVLAGLAAWYVILRRRRVVQARGQTSAATHGEV